METFLFKIIFGIWHISVTFGANVDMCSSYNQTLDTGFTLTYNNASTPGSAPCSCIIQSHNAVTSRMTSIRVQRTSQSSLCFNGTCQSCNDTEVHFGTSHSSFGITADFTTHLYQDLVVDVTGDLSNEFQVLCGSTSSVTALVGSLPGPSSIAFQDCQPVFAGTTMGGAVPPLAILTTAAAVSPVSQGMDEVFVYIILAVVAIIVIMLLLLVLYVVIKSDRWKARRQGTPKILEETAKSGSTSVNGSVSTGFDPPKFETYIDAYNESSTDPVQQQVIQAEIKNNNYYMKGTATDYYKNESSTDDIDDNFLIHQTQTITLPREIQLIDRALEHEPGYLTVDSKHTTDTSGYQTTDSRHSQQRMSTFQGLDITIRDNKPKDPVHVSQPIVTSPAGKHSMKDYKWEHADHVTKIEMPATYSHQPSYNRQESQERTRTDIQYMKQDSHESTHIPFMIELKERQSRRDSGIEDNSPKTEDRHLSNPAYHSETEDSDIIDGTYSHIGLNTRQEDPPQGQHIPKVFRTLFYPDRPDSPDNGNVSRSEHINLAYTDDAETGEREQEQSPPTSVYMGNFILRPKGADFPIKRTETSRSAGEMNVRLSAKQPEPQQLSQSVIDVNSNFILRHKSSEPLKNTPKAKQRSSPGIYALPDKKSSDPYSDNINQPSKLSNSKSPVSDGDDQELSNLQLTLPPPAGFDEPQRESYAIESNSPSSPAPPVPPPPQLETPPFQYPVRKQSDPRSTTSTIIHLEGKVPPTPPTKPPPSVTPPRPEKHLVHPNLTRPTPPPPDIGSKPPPAAHAPIAIHPKHGKYKRVKANKLPYYQQESNIEPKNSLKQSSHLMNGNKYFAMMNNELVLVNSDGKEDVMM